MAAQDADLPIMQKARAERDLEAEASHLVSDAGAGESSGRSCRQQASFRSLFLGAGSLSAFAAVGVLIASSSGLRFGPFPWTSRSDAVTADKEMPRKGCSNWKSLLMKPAILGRTKEECIKSCRNTPGCRSSNFQPGKCGDPSVGARATTESACHLYGSGCILEDNSCWDLYVAPGPPSFNLSKGRYGCSNWEKILQEESNVENVYQCSVRCYVQSCSADECADAKLGNARGSCYLYKDKCELKENPCWDLYEAIPRSAVLQYSSISEPAGVGETSLKLSSVDGFKPGAAVAIMVDRDGAPPSRAVSSRRLESTIDNLVTQNTVITAVHPKAKKVDVYPALKFGVQPGGLIYETSAPAAPAPKKPALAPAPAPTPPASAPAPPAPPTPGAVKVTALAPALFHSVAMKSDGSVWTAGKNLYGRLGDGTTVDRKSFLKVATKAASIGSGAFTTAYVATDGSVYVVGRNKNGQLGDNTAEDRSNFVKVAADGLIVCGGSMHTILLKKDETVWATGKNSYGQLGRGDTSDSHAFVQVATGARAVSAGAYFTGMVKKDGTLWTAGKGAAGQLADGGNANKDAFQKVADSVQAVACGAEFIAALKNDGSVWTAGEGARGQLADQGNVARNTLRQVATDRKEVSGGFGMIVSLKNDGSVWTAGVGVSGQLGDSAMNDRNSFQQIETGAQAAAAGGYHTVVLMTDGKVKSTGMDSSGQLADGANTFRNSLQEVTF